MAQLITVKSAKENRERYEKAEAVVLFLCKECADHIHMLSLPEEFYDAVAWQIKTQGYGFTDTGSITTVLLKTKAGFTRVIFAGIGAGKACTPNHLRIAAGNAARELEKNKIKDAVAAGPLLTDPKRGHYLKALAEGLLLGSYAFDKYKSKKENGDAAVPERKEAVNDGVPGESLDSKDTITVTVFSAIENAGAIIGEATVTCNAVCRARDLANEPGNVMYPETLAEEALQVAEEYGLDAEVLRVKEMQALGMGAILAVGAGSAREPRMITLKYANGGDKPFTAFVGKGITFDSGGISIKPSDGMGEMKDDMTGAAAVLGAMQAIAALKLPVNIIGVMACAENMPSGSAQRPGDIIRAGSGKTIEVDNTDAEGRLVLADAVWYACRKGAVKVVDIATLTGAVIIALGEHTSGIVSNNDALAEEIKKAGHRVGEGWWQ
ncbi:MAG: leucyl aminopeptidase, partial [Acidaminococcaceae bacterium]|nr:leucyl aminopeptidase [Acidaminococcaceae bacterium]